MSLSHEPVTKIFSLRDSELNHTRRLLFRASKRARDWEAFSEFDGGQVGDGLDAVVGLQGGLHDGNISQIQKQVISVKASI